MYVAPDARAYGNIGTVSGLSLLMEASRNYVNSQRFLDKGYIMKYKLSNRTKKELETVLDPQAAGELFALINALSEEVSRLSQQRAVSSEPSESPRYS